MPLPQKNAVIHVNQLDSHSRRVLGVLLEKEQTTPDYYPLTLNALIAACNQTTNRDPVMNLKRHEVLTALHTLERHGLVQRVVGPRADRWSHLLVQRIYTSPPTRALLTVLLLRGAQTPGELKARTERMHSFTDPGQVEEALGLLTGHDPPLVRRLPRSPGQKETRWMLALPDGAPQLEVLPVEAPETAEDDLAGRLRDLEQRVARLESRLEEFLRGPREDTALTRDDQE